MALWTLEKAPFFAIFHPFFDDFRQVFLRACPSGRKLARMRPRKALVLGPEKGSGTFCRNGPKGASRKTFLTPFPARGAILNRSPSSRSKTVYGMKKTRVLRVDARRRPVASTVTDRSPWDCYAESMG